MVYTCSKCKLDKTKDEMYWRYERQKISTVCKICYKEYRQMKNRQYRDGDDPNHVPYNPNPTGHPMFYNQIFGKMLGNEVLQ